jgi:hypothetical protein
MKGIYKFYWDCGRMGYVSGVFVASAEEVAEVIGKHVDFGEALGKHSQVHGTLEEGEITLLSDKPEDIEVFERLNLENGCNPITTYADSLV